jgi:hypothetical protein
MTTHGDTAPSQPEAPEPLGQLLGEVLDLVDGTVAQITDDVIEERLKTALDQSGHSSHTPEPLSPETPLTLVDPVSERDETDQNTDLAPRQEVAFDCPKGHHFTVPFATEAEASTTWECRVCGAIAFNSAADLPSPKKVNPPRSHWDMLRERRAIANLEQALAERLTLIRGEDAREQDPSRRGTGVA